MAACKRAVQLGAHSGLSLTKFRRFSNPSKAPAVAEKLQLDGYWTNFVGYSSTNSSFNRVDSRQISQLAKPDWNRVCLVDTLALERSLEAQGVPSKQAEAITAAITEVLNDSLQNVAHSFVSKGQMEKLEKNGEGPLIVQQHMRPEGKNKPSKALGPRTVGKSKERHQEFQGFNRAIGTLFDLALLHELSLAASLGPFNEVS